MNWLVNSQNGNPIEHACDAFKRRISAKMIKEVRIAVRITEYFNLVYTFKMTSGFVVRLL